MAQDHNDIYSIVERLRILEEGLTPTSVKHGLNAQQKSVNQLSATFKPKTVAVLTAKKDPKNPMAGKLVGGCEESAEQEEALEEAVANEDVLEKVKASFADYLRDAADKFENDTDLKDKVKVDRDLGKKDKQDRDLIAKEADVTTLETSSEELDEGQRLHVGDPVIVTAPNKFKGKTGEIAEFSPSGKFVVVNLYNHGEHSMHLSDVEYNEYVDDENDDEDYDAGYDAYKERSWTESAPVKTVTNECGLWEIHGDEPKGFEIRYGNRPMKSKFKTIEEAEMALEMFAARRAQKDESADYIEEA